MSGAIVPVAVQPPLSPTVFYTPVFVPPPVAESRFTQKRGPLGFMGPFSPSGVTTAAQQGPIAGVAAALGSVFFISFFLQLIQSFVFVLQDATGANCCGAFPSVAYSSVVNVTGLCLDNMVTYVCTDRSAVVAICDGNSWVLSGTCPGPCGDPPEVDGLEVQSGSNFAGSSRYYICSDPDTSFTVNSADAACPVAKCTDGDWSTPTGSCEEEGFGGTESTTTSVFGTSGSWASPEYPDVFGTAFQAHYLSIVTESDGIDFEFEGDYDLSDAVSSCDGFTALRVYCGMNVNNNNPDFTFCGDTRPDDFSCDSGCAILRFAVTPFTTNGDEIGFNISWSAA